MTRDSAFDAVILQVQSYKENSRVTALSCKKGVFSCILYGGAKSKYKSLVAPFNAGKMWLYTPSATPEKQDFAKITDFKVSNFHPSFATSLYKSFAALLASEIIIKTRCSGENEKTWYFFTGFLDGLDLATQSECKLGLLRFLWRYIAILGLQPDCLFCSKCQSPLKDAYFLQITQGFLCQECCVSPSSAFYVPDAVLKYLYCVNVASPKVSRQQELKTKDYDFLKNLLFCMIEQGCNTKLKTLEAAKGVL